jgi:hypothetical protein
MDKAELRNFFRPIIVFFVLINAVCLTCGKWLNAKGIDYAVLIYANLILFVLTIIACFIHIKAVKSKNPYAFVRGVTMASFLKLIVIAASVAVYFALSETQNIYAVGIAMAFYIAYTIFEVKGAMRLNRDKNAKN